MASATPFTVRFYDPITKAKDDSNRCLDDILDFSDDELESCHDFIQYLFPLPESSPINPDAPIVTKAVRDAFVGKVELRRELLRSVRRMAEFYGFTMSCEETSNELATLFLHKDSGRYKRASRSTWRMRFNHNHLRITRIIRCLRVLGEEDVARGLHRTFLQHNDGSISDRTLKYWERATYRPLYLAPEIDDATERGIEWLRGIQSPERAPEDGPDNNSMRLAVRPIEVTRGVIG